MVTLNGNGVTYLGFLRLLPRLPVTSSPHFIFPKITCCRRQFLRKIWPIKLAFRLLISCRIFFCFLILNNTFSFLTWSVQLISILLQHHISYAGYKNLFSDDSSKPCWTVTATEWRQLCRSVPSSGYLFCGQSSLQNNSRIAATAQDSTVSCSGWNAVTYCHLL
jgi:hypothetical protein